MHSRNIFVLCKGSNHLEAYSDESLAMKALRDERSKYKRGPEPHLITVRLWEEPALRRLIAGASQPAFKEPAYSGPINFLPGERVQYNATGQHEDNGAWGTVIKQRGEMVEVDFDGAACSVEVNQKVLLKGVRE